MRALFPNLYKEEKTMKEVAADIRIGEFMEQALTNARREAREELLLEIYSGIPEKLTISDNTTEK